MPIPDLQVFQSFLSHLDLESQDGYQSEIAIPETGFLDLSTAATEKEVRLWFKPIGDFTLQTLVSRMQRELEASGHKTQQDACSAYSRSGELHQLLV